MLNFDKQPNDTKAYLHTIISERVEAVGGLNFFLALIEAVKDKKPNALTSKECKIISENVSLTWNKIIFKDKLEVLEEAVKIHKNSNITSFNILDTDNQKIKKKTINMAKTLSPIEFNVKPLDEKYGSGFNFKVFDSIEDDNVKLNPLFLTLFFSSTEFSKKAVKFTI